MPVGMANDLGLNDLFGSSYTARHSVDRSWLEEFQRSGLEARFTAMAESIAMVSKLASRQGITKLSGISDVLPLLFEHTMYKSYPPALLERQRFDRLTAWLAKLTCVDLAAADTSGCDSIESWRSTLISATDMELLFTSGTSGSLSFIPWSRSDIAFRSLANRVGETQIFGREPAGAALDEPYHFIGAPAPGREYYTLGRPEYLHLRSARRPDADLLWLAARLKLAEMRGDASKADVPPSLLSRRGEVEALYGASAHDDLRWLAEVAGLQGQLVCWVAYPYDIYAVAAERVANGERWSFAPGSVIRISGGAKGRDLPEGWRRTVTEFTDARIVEAYGMTEMSTLNFKCTADRFHLDPWIIPFILNPDSGTELPRAGRQTGRFAYFDLAVQSHWGGLMTGDEVEVDFDAQCQCGATTQSVGPVITRLSEKHGGTDKISCAATPEAYAEAMEFLTRY